MVQGLLSFAQEHDMKRTISSQQQNYSNFPLLVISLIGGQKNGINAGDLMRIDFS